MYTSTRRAMAAVLVMGLGAQFALGAQFLSRNGSMELGTGPIGPNPRVPADWYMSEGTIERSEQISFEPATDGHSLKAFGANEIGAWQIFPVSPGQQVDASVMMQSLGSDPIGGPSHAGIEIEFLDVSSNALATIGDFPISSSGTYDEWVEASVSDTAPAGAVMVVVRMQWNGGPGSLGSAFWDDAVATINGGENVLLNSSFEESAITSGILNGIDEWSGFGTQEKSEDFAYVGTSGVKMLAVDSGGSSFNGIYQDLGLVTAGDHIVFKAKAMHPASDPLTVNAQGGLKMEFLATDEAPDLPAPYENLPIDENATTNSWQLLDLGTTGLTVPDGANFARIVLIYDVPNFNASTNGEIWFDSAFATTGGGNKLFNSSMESGTGGANGILFWTEFGLAPISTARAYVPFENGQFLAHDDLTVVQCKGRTTAGIYQDVAVTPGQTLNASVYWRIPQGKTFSPDAGMRAGIKVEWQGGDKPQNIDVGPTGHTLLKSDPTNQWKDLMIDYTVPQGQRGNLRFTFLLGFVGTGTVYFDAAEAIIYNRFEDGADFNGDNDQDLRDLAAFQRCYGGANVDYTWPCSIFDIDQDDDVDIDDWSAIEDATSVPNVP